MNDQVQGGPTTNSSQQLVLERSFSLSELVTEPNIADLLDEESLKRIGKNCFDRFKQDLESRVEWEKRMEGALALALQVLEIKTFPWEGAANVKFPLITIAALQYHARAYPALVIPGDIVRYKTYGADPDGAKDALGSIIGSHMTYQLTEEDESWEEDMDRALLVQPILGCVFKKTYFDAGVRHNVSECVLPHNLVVPYYTVDLATTRRASHILPPMSKNDIHERVERGVYLPLTGSLNEGTTTTLSGMKMERLKAKSQGIVDNAYDPDRPYEMVEQHCYLDLDDDGYEEPYIVTFRVSTMQVVRIKARYIESSITWNAKKTRVVSIRADQYFTKYPFIPSPDGGFYDIGFGTLLAPLNESINTIINQLHDAGTMSTLGSGFLGRGARLKAGDNMFKPGEWKQVNATGDDLGKSVVALPRPEPSNVLLELLKLLIQYGERVAGSVEQMTGETPDQNTPAETSRNALNEGMKIFTGIFKRTYRAMREEFRKLYLLNRNFLTDDPNNNPFKVTRKVYMMDEKGVRPAADPNVMSDSLRMAQAAAVVATATGAGGQQAGYDMHEVQKFYLESWKIENGKVERLLPDPKGPRAVKPQPNPKLIAEENKAKGIENKGKQIEFNIRSGMVKLADQMRETEAKIHKIEAEATKIKAETSNIANEAKLKKLEHDLDVQQEKHKVILESLSMLGEWIMHGKDKGGEGGATGGDQGGAVGGMAQAPGNQGGAGGAPQGNPGPQG